MQNTEAIESEESEMNRRKNKAYEKNIDDETSKK